MQTSHFRAGTVLLLAAFCFAGLAHTQAAPQQPATKPAQGVAAATYDDDELPQLGGVDPAATQAAEKAISEPRRIAAAVVAQDNPAPRMIVEVDAYDGAFLAIFLEKFPTAHGLWTEGDRENIAIASQKLARFGDRVDFKIACANREITSGCIPAGTDVIITDWMSIHQDLDGMYKGYRAAAAALPTGGWFVNIDNVGFGGTGWEQWLKSSRKGFRPEHEGPAIHHADMRLPTVEEQLGAMRAAGFDAEVVWQSFGTVLFMGKKK